MTMSAVVKLAREIDELVTDIGGYGMVSQFTSSQRQARQGGAQGSEERVLALWKDTTSHPSLCHPWVAFGVRSVCVKKLAKEDWRVDVVLGR